MMFPQLRKHLGGHAEVKNLYGVALSGNLDDYADAYAWLSIGVCRLSDARIYGCILSSLAQLKVGGVRRIDVFAESISVCGLG